MDPGDGPQDTLAALHEGLVGNHDASDLLPTTPSVEDDDDSYLGSPEPRNKRPRLADDAEDENFENTGSDTGPDHDAALPHDAVEGTLATAESSMADSSAILSDEQHSAGEEDDDGRSLVSGSMKQDIAQFDERMIELEAFKAKYGHCRVPQVWRENKRLGQWVATMRNLRKANKLSEEHIRQLDAIGFVWCCRSVTASPKGEKRKMVPWNERFEELKVETANAYFLIIRGGVSILAYLRSVVLRFSRRLKSSMVTVMSHTSGPRTSSYPIGSIVSDRSIVMPSSIQIRRCDSRALDSNGANKSPPKRLQIYLGRN